MKRRKANSRKKVRKRAAPAAGRSRRGVAAGARTAAKRRKSQSARRTSTRRRLFEPEGKWVSLGASPIADERVAAVIQQVETFVTREEDANALPRGAGEFVHALILAGGATRCVEIGTGFGYSGLWIAAALRDRGGKLVTIDRNAEKSAAAAAQFETAGLADLVECRTGVALDVLGTLEGPIDFVLNDADKEFCVEYLETLEPKLADRAMVLTDNTGTHARELADFLAWVRSHEAFWSTNVPIGNGMELTIRRPR